MSSTKFLHILTAYKMFRDITKIAFRIGFAYLHAILQINISGVHGGSYSSSDFTEFGYGKVLLSLYEVLSPHLLPDLATSWQRGLRDSAKSCRESRIEMEMNK